jgi:uncharacterized protein YukE
MPYWEKKMANTARVMGLLVASLVWGMGSSQASADEFRHIDQLAVKIQRTTKRLINEVRHYRHTSEYRHLLSDSQEIYRLATHIHDVTHFEGRLAHLESDLRELDRKFHHLESVFDRVEHNARFSGGGHIHGNTAHVKRLLESIEDSIHHMRSDVADLRRRTSFHRDEDCYHYTRPVYRNYYGSYGSRSHLHGGVGFSIGGGSSRIYIGF